MAEEWARERASMKFSALREGECREGRGGGRGGYCRAGQGIVGQGRAG